MTSPRPLPEDAEAPEARWSTFFERGLFHSPTPSACATRYLQEKAAPEATREAGRLKHSPGTEPEEPEGERQSERRPPG